MMLLHQATICYVNSVCNVSTTFIFDLNKWMYNGKDQTWTQILGTKRLVPGTIKKLKFRRIKTSYGNLKIGITQRQIAKDQRNPPNNRSIFYLIDNCNLYFLGTNVNQYSLGVKTCEIVELTVDLIKGEISWNFNGNFIVHNSSKQFLLNKSIEWTPFVAFYRTGDCV